MSIQIDTTNWVKNKHYPEYMDDIAISMISKGYLLPDEDVFDAYKRVSKAASRRLRRKDLQPFFYEAIVKNWLCLASPVLSNLGTERGMPISCFGINVGDSIEGIADANSELMRLTSQGGGVGIGMSRIRGRGKPIKDNGVSEGVVFIEESKTGETYLETVEGMQIDRGYKSPYFVTDNNNMSCILNDALVLIADKKFTQVKELLPILEAVSAQNKSLLIIAEDIEGEALATLIVNKMRGTIKACAIKAPDFGDRRKLILEDLATLTGGQVFSTDKGMKLDKFSWDWFGGARVVTINKENTTIIDGKGSEEKIDGRINELQFQIEKAQSPYEREKLQERLAKLVGGVAIIHVGGNTEAELKEKKDRVDDALNATKAAIEEGIVPGGGAALLYAKEAITKTREELNSDVHIGKSIVHKACFAPFMKILKNAGYSDSECYGLINQANPTRTWDGFNLKTEAFVNMKEAGIIDPAKVTRCALENAASIAGTILLTEVAIVEEPEEKKTPNNEFGDLGGMY